MRPLAFVAGYYPLFGVRGVWLAARARLRQTSTEVAVAVPGIKHPVHLRLRTSDVSTFRQVLITEGYACDFCQSPQNIIDAGANIGLTSIYYANRYPEALIIALEPEQSNFLLLRKNAARYPQIVPVNAALWRNNEELDVIDSGLGEWGFQTTADAPDRTLSHRKVGKTPGLTIDAVMRKYGMDCIDLLKVDIEGSEKDVFENSHTWIKQVGAIAIELHDDLRPGCGRAFEDASRDFERICRRGETLFVARSARKCASESSFHALENAVAGRSSKKPCRILEAF
jgi:FkbM family methyltransferase